jgi:hypothetical protein
MTDKPTVTTIEIRDPHRVPVTFCNQVVGSGHLNNVVNITLAVAQFTPSTDNTINPDLVIAARLRMDLFAARQLHEALGAIIEQALKPANGTTH